MKIFFALLGFVVVLVVSVYTLIMWYTPSSELPIDAEIPLEGEITIPADQLDPVSDFAPQETYEGSEGGETVRFSQQEYQRYELEIGQLTYRGDMNTERGWQSDPDATIYVLNWQRPEAEQLAYVRTTANPDILIKLDSNRVPAIPRAELRRVAE